MKKRIDIVGAVFTRNGKILAAKRSDTMALPGLWEFPGGKIEPGESPEQALLREIAEELRCVVEVKGRLTTTEHEYPFGTVTLSTYFVELKGADPRLTQHAEIRWLAKHELFDVEWAPADVPAVELLAKQGWLD
jgi:8-oxo-dGTP diphosphatase